MDAGTGNGIAQPQQTPWGGYPTPREIAAAGMFEGVSPHQFTAGINVMSRQLGNRTLMHWVGQLYSAEQNGDTHAGTAQGLQGVNRPLTRVPTDGVLQLMLKKQKNTGKPLEEKAAGENTEGDIGNWYGDRAGAAGCLVPGRARYAGNTGREEKEEETPGPGGAQYLAGRRVGGIQRLYRSRDRRTGVAAHAGGADWPGQGPRRQKGPGAENRRNEDGGTSPQEYSGHAASGAPRAGSGFGEGRSGAGQDYTE